MTKAVNTFKSTSINEKDSLFISGVQKEYDLDGINDIKDDLFLIYIYRLPEYQTHGFKLGYAKCKLGKQFWDSIKRRIDAQIYELALHEGILNDRYEKYGYDREVLFWGIAIDVKDEEFKDHPIHDAILDKLPGVVDKNQEWFSGTDITFEDLADVFLDYRSQEADKIPCIYTPRKEQRECVDVLKEYFKKNPEGNRFLLNCKMRFGKCYTAYKYAEETKKKRVLILTFVPAVEDSWRQDLKHIEEQYDYFTDSDISKRDFRLDDAPEKPYVLFLSLQNYLGKDSKSNGVKEKISKLENKVFDLLILDEYHFGAWNDRTQETLEELDTEYQKRLKAQTSDIIINTLRIIPLQTICLSGTPFKAIDRGEFSDNNSFTYSYFDEQKNKYPNAEKLDFSIVNPAYEHFPDMKIFGYNMANLFEGILDDLSSEVKIFKKKFFSLNAFFKTEKDSDSTKECKFVYEEHVKKWIDVIQGKTTFPYEFPYRNEKMLHNNKHTLWLMPTINSCIALSKLLKEDSYFKKYEIINLSAPEVGAGYKALKYLKRRIKASEQRGALGTIAITVNKLTLGVTVKEWSSVFVLKDLTSPEQYFQSIFRVQTPYVENDEIIKKQSYVYDFNIDRASALLLHYAEKTSESYTKLEVANLIIRYLPIYLNGDMTQPIAEEVFYELASFGYNSKPLSDKVKDISKTTRGLDEQTIADMLNDPECSAVIKNIFAHTKFSKPTSITTPPDSEEGSYSVETRKGRKIGQEKGLMDYKIYLLIDDENVQEEFDKNVKLLADTNCPVEYDEKQRKYFYNGVLKGYESGVNIPIKKLQCGKNDGEKFVDEIRKALGDDIVYNTTTKAKILDIVHKHLNNEANIPEEYRKKMYKKWYRDSFRGAVQSILKPKIKPDSCGSVEDTHNVLKHILSKVFQFLYISVYRETRFKDVFANADPYVFHSAVGIKKEEFEILNRYNVFQERVLDSYIHEFFVNESLGKNLLSGEEINKNYRNSFNWFGYGIVKFE